MVELEDAALREREEGIERVRKKIEENNYLFGLSIQTFYAFHSKEIKRFSKQVSSMMEPWLNTFEKMFLKALFGSKMNANVNNNFHIKQEIVSDDPDRFAIDFTKAIENVNKHGVQAFNAIAESS